MCVAPHGARAKIQNSALYKFAAELTFSSFYCVCKYSFLVVYLLSWLNNWISSGWPRVAHAPKFKILLPQTDP